MPLALLRPTLEVCTSRSTGSGIDSEKITTIRLIDAHVRHCWSSGCGGGVVLLGGSIYLKAMLQLSTPTRRAWLTLLPALAVVATTHKMHACECTNHSEPDSFF